MICMQLTDRSDVTGRDVGNKMWRAEATTVYMESKDEIQIPRYIVRG